MIDLPIICSFWHGDIGWLGRLCIASFLERGHRFELYAYDDVGPVPAGCVRRDANDIIPQNEMFFYKGSRTPAVFADLFRLRLMQHRAGIWVDCDVYCVRPFEGLGDYVYGLETSSKADRQMVNNAVFACPPDGELLESLLKTFEPGAMPPGMPWFRALEVRIRRLLGEDLPVQNMQFGTTGPWPLNYHLKRLGLFERAQAKPVFYPMDYGDAHKLMQPGIALADLVQPETLSAHFWHSSLTDRGSGQLAAPAPGSFFANELARLGAAFSF
jgi:hypothetical protein